MLFSSFGCSQQVQNPNHMSGVKFFYLSSIDAEGHLLTFEDAEKQLSGIVNVVEKPFQVARTSWKISAISSLSAEWRKVLKSSRMSNIFTNFTRSEMSYLSAAWRSARRWIRNSSCCMFPYM